MNVELLTEKDKINAKKLKEFANYMLGLFCTCKSAGILSQSYFNVDGSLR